MPSLISTLSRSCLALALASSSLLHAASLSEVQKDLAKGQADSAEVQRNIDQLDESTELDHQRYLSALRQAELIEAYNQQMAKLVTSQQRELEDLQQQIDSLDESELAALPMLGDMLQGLELLVEQDLPFFPEEREERLAKLRDTLDRADVSLAEKYRQLLDAYQVEVEYGRVLEAYRGQLRTETSSSDVVFLKLGRTALYYQSLDGRQSALWDSESQRWKALPESANQGIQQAIQLARKQVVPDLLTLPLPSVRAQEVN